jgi:hypothetical protein
MRQFDRDGARHKTRIGGIPEVTREKYQHGAKSLATGLEQVPCRLAHRRLARVDRNSKAVFDTRQISSNVERDRVCEILGHRPRF